jgi:hypothetical protein
MLLALTKAILLLLGEKDANLCFPFEVSAIDFSVLLIVLYM